jgi:FtsP/CotA-like multicopper oxidase with cupredoxin domain
MKINQVKILALFLLLSLTLVLDVSAQPASSKPTFLDPLTIPKWINQLDSRIPVYVPKNVTDSQGNVIRQEYVVSVSEFYQQILPTVDLRGNPTGYGPSKVWGYGGEAINTVTGEKLGFVRSVPGPTFETTRGIPAQVKWINDLVDNDGNPLQHMYPVDPTIHWANPNNIDMETAMEQTMQGLAPPFPPGYNGTPYIIPGTTTITNPEGWNAQSPVPIVTHLHGGQVPSDYDGSPEQWFTPNGIHGKDYRTASATEPNAAIFYYPNAQVPTALWYHDHALGMTRINLFSGLAGFYILRDPADSLAPLLPSGPYEMPLIIQDRTFLADGSIYYPSDGYYPNYEPYPVNYTKENPYSLVGFVGNTIMVNGKVWPNMNVSQGQYRFRILDASNARFYNISFSNGMPFTLIGSDGGYLKSPVSITSMLFSPAERIDILVDFSKMAPGEKVILKNNALWNLSSPKFPNQEKTVGQIMQFTVTADKGFEPKSLPLQLNPTLVGDYPNLQTPTKVRILTLGENVVSAGPELPMDLYLDGQKWAAPVSENPELGTTEEWVFVNTFDTHNMHLHLVQFQLVSRQNFNLTAYWNDWIALNGEPPLNHTTVNVPSLDPYLMGEPILPGPSEQGWKDTIIVFSRQITVIRVRFAPEDGSDFPFDATTGPGYVWHCHILEHEDNEMMRPYIVTQASGAATPQELIIAIVVLIVAITLVFIGLKKYQSETNREKLNQAEQT